MNKIFVTIDNMNGLKYNFEVPITASLDVFNTRNEYGDIGRVSINIESDEPIKLTKEEVDASGI